MEEKIELENVITAEEQEVIDNLENMSNESLLEIVLSKLPYDPIKDVLVKPLAPFVVKRMVKVPVETEELDEEGKPLMKMEEQERELESNFREGIVLALPANVTTDSSIVVGSTIVYNSKFNAIEFDLLKDSVLVKPYDILFVKKSA